METILTPKQLANLHKKRGFYTLRGGNAALDFVNTAKNNGELHGDQFSDYEHFAGWCHDAQVIDYDYFKHLNFEGYCDVYNAKQAHAKVLSVRETLYWVILGVATGREVYNNHLHAFNCLVDEAHAKVRYESNGSGVFMTWVDAKDDLATPLYIVILMTANLLVSPDADLIKKCDGCDGFFMDRTKNASKRWCSPVICGNKQKTERYYRKKQKSSNPL